MHTLPIIELEIIFKYSNFFEKPHEQASHQHHEGVDCAKAALIARLRMQRKHILQIGSYTPSLSAMAILNHMII